MPKLMTLNDFEKMYLKMIQDKSYIKGLISRGSFENWIQTTVYDNPEIHLKTLEILKPKLIEFEFYEQVIQVDNLIQSIKKQINDMESK